MKEKVRELLISLFGKPELAGGHAQNPESSILISSRRQFFFVSTKFSLELKEKKRKREEKRERNKNPFKPANN